MDRGKQDGRPNFMEMRRKEQHLLVEEVGERLRARMPFLNPVTIAVEEPQPLAKSELSAAHKRI